MLGFSVLDGLDSPIIYFAVRAVFAAQIVGSMRGIAIYKLLSQLPDFPI